MKVYKNKLTIIESPFAGNVKFNKEYAKLCVKDSINRDETPFASHLFYTQVLNDGIESERDLGLKLGFNIMKLAARVAVYTDLGISTGMKLGIKNATNLNLIIEYRKVLSKNELA